MHLQYILKKLFFFVYIVKQNINEISMQPIKNIFSRFLKNIIKTNIPIESISIAKLSIRFDLMQHERIHMPELVRDTYRIAKHYPVRLRANMFREALKTPSGLYSDFYFESRFLDFFDSSFGAMGNRLIELAEHSEMKTIFTAELESVSNFYQFLFDAFNKRFIGTLDHDDLAYQQRILSSLKYAQDALDLLIDDGLKERSSIDPLIKIKKMLVDLHNNATISFE